MSKQVRGFYKGSYHCNLMGHSQKHSTRPYYSKVPIYCVIDTLDECKDHDGLLSRIQQILSVPTTSFNKPHKLKLLVTSRPEVNARCILSTLVCVDPKATIEDIETFVREKVRTLPESFDIMLREKAAELMLSQAEQTFLWVSIVVKKNGEAESSIGC